uniref:TFIIS N-terminal domain-containing protein n=1 Tax=Oryza glumipatula TaxID=40148 RepID=A0A0D9ZX19_9ORYZ
MAAARNPLRRWKPFLAAFASVDDAIEIEAADLGISRGELRRARGRIVGMLRGAEDDREAEELCSVLDEVMAESLLTLRLVPVTPKTLATTDLAGVVGALRKHDSERIRGLATDIVRRWRAAVKRDLVRIGVAMEKLSQTPERIEAADRPVSSDLDAKVKRALPVATAKASEPSLPKRSAPADMGSATKPKEPTHPPKKKPPAVTGSAAGRRDGVKPNHSDGGEKLMTAATKRKLDVDAHRQEAEEAQMRRKTADMAAAAKPEVSNSLPLLKLLKMVAPAVVASHGRRESIELRNDEEKIAAAKRKLREGYQEAEEAKKRRKIHVIEDPKLLKHKQEKMHNPILSVRSRASHASSMAEKKKSFLISSLGRL